MRENPLEQVLTFAEATKRWGLGHSTLREAAKHNRFLPGETRKSGGTWLVTEEAMRRLYGEPKGGKNMKKYLANAFSIQMLSGPATVRFEEIDAADVPSDVTSAVGHADTANVLTNMLGFPVSMNRMNIALDENTELYVAQLVGGRLPEGARTLPEGFSFKFYRVTIV